MNATQTVARRMVTGMGPRLTAPVRYSSTSLAPRDRTAMRVVFTTGTLVTIGGVAYSVSLVDLVLDMLPIDFSKKSNETYSLTHLVWNTAS